MGERIVNNFEITPTNIQEIMIFILQLDDSKSTGPDNLPVNLIKIAAPIIAPVIVSIFNLSFALGQFPNLMKLAKVIPIFKADLTIEFNNYRPISLLAILSKILEKLMHKRLSNFLTLHSVIFESQFGFQKSKSTSHSLIEIIDKIRMCIDKSNYGCGIFIDLKKAFDTVNHKILLQKLEHYGIRGTCLDWFASYLSGRSQYVFCNGVNSDIKSIKCGVHRGLYWVLCYFYYILMICLIFLLN